MESVVVAQFRKNSTDLYFKRCHNDEEFACADFLKKSFKKMLETSSSVLSPVSKYDGVNEERRDQIVTNLLPMMPENQHAFWKNEVCCK